MVRKLLVVAMVAGMLAAAAEAGAVGNWSGPLYKFNASGSLTSKAVSGSKATLVRHDDAVNYTVNATGLKEGHAYTVWLFAWNHPEFCLDPDAARGFKCGSGDFGNAAAFFSLMWGAGGVADGTTHVFTGERRRFDLSRVILGPGIGNPMEAEVKMIVRDHGPASKDPAMRRAQTTTVDGGCSNPAMPPTGLHGPAGDNVCKDILATGTV